MSEHQLLLPDGTAIPYQLERRQRRTVGLKISSQGLIIHAPSRIAPGKLEEILLSKSRWILNKLQTQQERVIEAFEWQHGNVLLLLGNELVLNIKHDYRSRAIESLPGALHVALPEPENQASVARKVVQWYRKEALADFGRRLELLSARLGVATPSLYLSNARSRWGSCNSKKEIRLNWRLLQAPPHIINYVAAHELAHLKEMNHSARFWSVVETICPAYRQAEKDLKAWSHRLHRI